MRQSKKVTISDAKYASLAQLVEHLTLNQGVVGSNPTRSTKTKPAVSMTVGFFMSIKRS